MSTESDLKRTFPVTLSHHRDRPEHQRPIYHFRFMSIRDRRDFENVIRKAQGYAKSIAGVLAEFSTGNDESSDEPKGDEANARFAEALNTLNERKASEGQAIIAEAEELVRRFFAGWTRPETPAGEPVEGDFDPSRYDEVFDESDLEDLLHTLPDESKLKAVDRKNSIARLIRNSEDAAPTAAEQPAA